MQPQNGTLDFSGMAIKSEIEPERGKKPSAGKTIAHVAVIIVSFTVTFMLYAGALKSLNPEKPAIKLRPAIDGYK